MSIVSLRPLAFATFYVLCSGPTTADLISNGSPSLATVFQGRVTPVSDSKTRSKNSPRKTGLPLPRYVSLRASKVNIRVGPGIRYPIKWVYMRRGLPLMITAEFDIWRKVRDWHGSVGWVHRSLLSGKRTVIVTAPEVVLRLKPSLNASAVARTQTGVVARVITCKGSWCRIEARGISGWGERNTLWGTLQNEEIN
jgi:SH3-like domain-containing protein